MPMLVSFGLSPAFNRVPCTFVVVYNLLSIRLLLLTGLSKMVLDDGGIVGSPELLLKVWEILKVGGLPLGLELNPKKCEWSWLNPGLQFPVPIEGVPITPTNEIKCLAFPSVLRSLLRSLSKGTS